MNRDELIEALEDLLMLDLGTLDLNKKLEEYEDWDSMAHLSLLALFDKIGKKLSVSEIRDLQTAGDILDKAGL